MHIAFISYEYPPDIAQGGIATYIQQITRILSEKNHKVEVFCASPYRTISMEENNVVIHRLKSENPYHFNEILLDFFESVHNFYPFDIIESPEIHGHAYLIKKRFPTLPLVVKFHMPIFLQMRLMNYYTPKQVKLRFFLGALRRGSIQFYGHYDRENDLDFKISKISDAYISPSKSLGDILKKEWKLNTKRLSIIPNPFTPPAILINLPIEPRSSKVVTFIGKLNVHKGLVNLVEMIPKVVRIHPEVQFRFIGNDSFYSAKNMTMNDYITKKLKGYVKNYVVIGGLDYSEVMKEISLSDVCIFPSIWENFPNVCLEAMSAGRAIIGSKNGGMSEMLENQAGCVIDPFKIAEGVNAINFLLDNPSERVKLGIKARKMVLERYNNEIIGDQIEYHFKKVIANAN
jgi:glycogen(starch) synthase